MRLGPERQECRSIVRSFALTTEPGPPHTVATNEADKTAPLLASVCRESTLRQALFLSVVFLVCVTPLTYWPKFGWLCFPFYDVGLGISFSIYAISLFIPKLKLPQLGISDLVLALFVGWVGLNAVTKGSWSAAKPLVDLVLLFFIVSHAGFSKNKSKCLLLTLTLTGTAVAAFGTYEYLVQHKHWVTSTLMNPNTLSGYLCLLLPMSFCLWKSEGRRLKLLGIAVTSVLAFAIALSRTRGGYLAALIGLSGFALLTDKRLFLVLFLYVVLFGTVVTGARSRVWPVRVVPSQGSPANDTIAQRIYVWQFAWREFKSSPLTGIGVGHFHNRLEQYLQEHPEQKDRYPNTRGPHNSYVKILCEVGAPGLFLFLSFLGYCMFKCVRTLFAGPDRADAWAIALFCGLVSFLLHNLTNTLFNIIPCALGFWISLGIFHRLTEREASRLPNNDPVPTPAPA